jgi:FtsZ-binding cell division protein ZapB
MTATPRFLTHTLATEPPMELYFPAVADSTRCQARRTDPDHADTRWTPAVYEVYQCKKAKIAGSDLCETCQGRKEREETEYTSWNGGSGWLGLITATAPDYSHTHGTAWFEKKAKWTGVSRLPTARKEGRLDRVPRVEQREIDRFLRGGVPLDIETLSQRNQISGQDLRDMISMLKGIETGVSKFNKGATKTELCEIIRRLMGGEDVDIRPRKKRTETDTESEKDMELDQVHALAEIQDEEITALKKENKTLKAKNADLAAMNDDIEAENAALQTANAALQNEIAALKTWRASVLATVSA